MENSQSQPLAPLAILFTNSSGSVVFADRRFLRLTEQGPGPIPSGQALHSLLSSDPQQVTGWMQTIARQGFLADVPLTLPLRGGARLPLSLDGVAAYDESNRFIGADVLLAQPAARRPRTTPLRHPDALASYFQQSLREAQVGRGMTFLQVYVCVQVEILQVLLARMGGPRMRAALESVINETAARLRIPAHMEQGYLEFVSSHTNIGHYRALLRAAFAYSVDAIGRRAVSQELSLIDMHVTPGLLPLVAHLDLDSLLEQ